jgi:hypothetical protein
MPARSASFTKSATTRTPILRIRLPRWNLIVFSVVPSSAAICLFSLPAHQLENLSFTLGKHRKAFRYALSLDVRGAQHLILGQRLVNGGNQRSVVYWLGQEIRRAMLHRLNARRDVATAGEKDDWQHARPLFQRPLHIEAVQARQREVEHEATRSVPVVAVEKLVRRRKRCNVQSDGFKQSFDRLQHIRIIVDNIHSRPRLAHRS